MIEVVVFHPGGKKDTAFATTPENAVLAARTMLREAKRGMRGKDYFARFYVDGEMVREEANP